MYDTSNPVVTINISRTATLGIFFNLLYLKKVEGAHIIKRGFIRLIIRKIDTKRENKIKERTAMREIDTHQKKGKHEW